MSVRLRRMYAEYERLKVLFVGHERIRIIEALGDPPDRYVVEYRVKGLVDNKGTIEESDVHRIRITLGPNYPNEMASYVAITPIFHPNIDYLAVCTADRDAASTKIEDNIVFIGRLITFQEYNLQSPRNGDAAKWILANQDRLPLEAVNLWPQKTLEGGAVPALRPDQIPAPSQAQPMPQDPIPERLQVAQPKGQRQCVNCGRWHEEAGLLECAGHHLVCRDCALCCGNCRQLLCVLCDLKVCSECKTWACTDCAIACAKCQRTVCPLHTAQCSLCHASRCTVCCVACVGCGGLFCGEHLDGAGRCPACSNGAAGASPAHAAGQADGVSLRASVAQELLAEPVVKPPLAAGERLVRAAQPVVITTEEALRVPQSALRAPDTRVQLAPATAPPPISGTAIASLVFGVVGLPVVGLLVGWFAVGFGIMAIREIDRTEQLRGRGMAIAGLTLGIVSIVFWAILLATYGPSIFTTRFGNPQGTPVRHL